MQVPAFPDVPPQDRTQGALYMRYEDVAQDGALKVGGMPAAIGLVCMGKLFFKTALSRELRAQGVVPILTRLTLQTTGGPLSVRHKVEADGVYQLAHTRDAQGEVLRILVNGHAELYAPVGRTHPPAPANAGTRVHVGRAFAEHAFTRPFGPPDQRKVLSLPTAAGALVPPLELVHRDALSTLALEGVRWLDEALSPDPTPLLFGLTHTDSNQHVNSLVYPQLFEDAALRRLSDLGHDTRALLVDLIDVAFRKPCFSGQRMFIALRAFERAGQLGAIAYLGPAGCTPEKAHTTCALSFRNGELAAE